MAACCDGRMSARRGLTQARKVKMRPAFAPMLTAVSVAMTLIMRSSRSRRPSVRSCLVARAPSSLVEFGDELVGRFLLHRTLLSLTGQVLARCGLGWSSAATVRAQFVDGVRATQALSIVVLRCAQGAPVCRTPVQLAETNSVPSQRAAYKGGRPRLARCSHAGESGPQPPSACGIIPPLRGGRGEMEITRRSNSGGDIGKPDRIALTTQCGQQGGRGDPTGSEDSKRSSDVCDRPHSALRQ